jgi:hypothetical protein
VAVDPYGNLLIANSPLGGTCSTIQVVAASTGTYYGQSMTAGDIYTVAGDGTSGYTGNGGPALSAELSASGVNVDANGNLLITDEYAGRIRVVAASTGTFYGQSMMAGHIYTVAGGGTSGLGDGGPATSGQLNDPRGATADLNGNLVITDTYSNFVQVVATTTGNFYGQPMTAGDIYTIAGNGTGGYAGDGGPAVSAELSEPDYVAIEANGDLLIGDYGNNRVRLVYPG